jgi:hypothetical protein
MSQAKHSDITRPVVEKLHREHVVHFLAEILQMTDAPQDQETFQRSLQTFVDGLQPWLEPSDGPLNPRVVFSLLEDFSCDATGEEISVVLSPEAEALFKAWLRRNKIWSDAGLHTVHAWSN